VKYLKPETIVSAFIQLSNKPDLMFSTDQRAKFLTLINKSKKSNKNELECRISFKNEHRPYGSCLVTNTIGNRYESPAMIRIYTSNSIRSTFTNLGSILVF
jgi:hypothetical protein